MSDIKRFFKHSAIYAIGNIVNRIGAFVLLPIYTNYLTVAEFGSIELLYTISSVVSGVLAIGLAHATLRFYFDYEEQSDRNASVSTNYFGSLVISIIGAGLILIFSKEITIAFFGSDDYQMGLYLVFGSLILELSSQICFAYIRAREYSIIFVVTSFAKLIFQVAVNTYLVVYAEAGIFGVLLGNLLAVFLGWAILSYITLRECGFSFHYKKFVPVLRYCFPLLLSTVVHLVSATSTRFILNAQFSLEALGIFALATKFSTLLEELVGRPFNNSYGAFRYTIMDRPDAGKVQADIVRYLLVGSAFMGLGLAMYIDEILYFMVGREFWDTADAVPVLVLAALFKLLSGPMQTGILYEKKTKYLFYIAIVSSVVSVVSSLVFIYFFGVLGACIAVLLTSMTNAVMTNYISQKFFLVEYEYFKWTCIFALITILFLISSVGISAGLILTIVLKGVLLLCYLVAIFVSPIMNADEIKSIKSLVFKKLGSSRSAG